MLWPLHYMGTALVQMHLCLVAGIHKCIKLKKKRFKVRMTLASRRHGSNFPSDGLFGIKKKLRSWESLLLAEETEKDYFICNSD